jgi:UDP-N-acetylmuramoyl-L-alanyl-D-glutamate--2,6-diaminopimelate ligase
MQNHLGVMADAGAHACAIEVSSHGLDQGRLNGCRFETAVFTNLTQDHLDYHGSMQAYGQAKARLFSWPSLRYVVINFDDDFGRGLVNEVAPSVTIYTYSAQTSDVDYVDIGVLSLVQHSKGIEATISTPVGTGVLEVGLIGRFNLSNLLATLAVLLLHKIELGLAISALNGVTTVCGRMQLIDSRVHNANVARAIVDYAHTPDALEQALMAAKEHLPNGKLWVVFGCGGDRDVSKRPKMAAIAERWADRVIVTDDNPRTEASTQILAHICSGFKRMDRVIVEADRGEAIALAMAQAAVDDLVLIAGKGHETYQHILGHKHHFSDHEQVHKAAKRGPS